MKSNSSYLETDVTKNIN